MSISINAHPFIVFSITTLFRVQRIKSIHWISRIEVSKKFSMTLKCDVRVKYCFIFLSCDIDKCQKQGICDCFKPNCHRVLQLTTQTDHIINESKHRSIDIIIVATIMIFCRNQRNDHKSLAIFFVLINHGSKIYSTSDVCNV